MSERTHILSRFDLTGRGAVVTGGSKGIGKNLALALSEAGARVLIAARNLDDLKSAAEEISAASGNPVDTAQVDLANRQSTGRFASEAQKILGGVDIFVANAAVEINEPVEGILDESVDPVVETNFTSSVVLTREFAKGMKARQWGRIIYISSATVYKSSADGHAIYSGTKAALHAFARTAAVELGGEGITVNAVAAGTYYTDMAASHLDALGPETKQAAMGLFSQMNAIGRWGRTDEMEGAVLLLASDASSFMTGSVVTVDGGLSIRLTPNYLAGS